MKTNIVEKKIRGYIEKALEQGYYLRRSNERNNFDFGEYLNPYQDVMGGCCLVGLTLAGAGIIIDQNFYTNGSGKFF